MALAGVLVIGAVGLAAATLVAYLFAMVCGQALVKADQNEMEGRADGGSDQHAEQQ